MLEELKEIMFRANMELPEKKLVIDTWGNVSGIDRASGLVVIKPSGVPYETMKAEDMVVVDLDGNVVEGDYRPSSDTPTHVVLYKAFPEIGGVVHTHSPWAVSFAQAGRELPAYGTTHADYFYGNVPCVPGLTKEEIEAGYERNTGESIVRHFAKLGIDPMAVPAALCQFHGPFTWGTDPHDAVHNAMVLEVCSQMAVHAEQLNPEIRGKHIPQEILDKHYFRKHGANAYYGQTKK